MSQLAGDRIRTAIVPGAADLDTNADVGGLLWDTFSSVHAALATGVDVDCTFSGATATVSMLRGRKLTSAWVGDSRAVLGRREDGTVRAYDLTNDHKPDLPEEHARIMQSGGRVEPLVVRPCHPPCNAPPNRHCCLGNAPPRKSERRVRQCVWVGDLWRGAAIRHTARANGAAMEAVGRGQLSEGFRAWWIARVGACCRRSMRRPVCTTLADSRRQCHIVCAPAAAQ